MLIRAGLSRYPSHLFIEGQAGRLSSPTLGMAMAADNACTWAFASEEPKLADEFAIRAAQIRLFWHERAEGLHQFYALDLA